MRPITHIVIHTSATRNKQTGEIVDASAASIRRYHIEEKGWSDIGYHFVVRMDGKIEEGRALKKAGAHVAGFNAQTIGICLSGHGNFAAPTPEQLEAAIGLVCDLIDRFNLVDEFEKNPSRVLGHRECYALDGVPNTGKSCPGRKVDMRSFRIACIAELKDRGLYDVFVAEDEDE